MSEGTKTLRLSKVAKEFNLSLGKIVEFLATKGYPVETNPNAKIGDGEYGLLLKEFSGDKSAREEADTVAQNSNKLKRETIVLDEVKIKKTKDEEFDEVVIKDLTASNNTPNDAPEKKEIKKEIVPEITPEVSKQGPEISEGPKVVGRLDLDAMNLKTKPDKKSKKDKDAEKAAPKAEEVVVPKKEEDVKAEVKHEVPVVAHEAAPVKEEPKEEFLDTKYEKLEGPKILGRIELPVVKESAKKGTAASNAASAADKKKRKRIRKGGLSQEEIKKVGKEQSAIAKERAK